jgi:hypothetical protein
MRLYFQWGLGLASALTLLIGTDGARADEPRKVGEPNPMREPTELVQVVDAFDEDDPFDLHLTLGYQHSWRSGNIRRESGIAQPGLSVGGFTSDDMNVARWTETTSRLNVGAQLGLFKDIALSIRLPVILGRDSKLEGLDGSENRQSTVLAGAPGEQLFRLPFQSPTRSGIEYLAVGLDFGIFNQYRDHTKPTWVVGFEGRFNVSEPMHACNPDARQLNSFGAAQQVDCAYPSDINRNGRNGEFPSGIPGSATASSLEGDFNGKQKPGVGRGTTAVQVHTYFSRRIKYVEPYAGFRALFEFANESSEYGRTDFKGSLVNSPPIRGTMLLGLTVYPWEVRDQHQRIAVDFRFAGTYVSEGRDYSPLFDALGSSDARSMRLPNPAEYQCAGGTSGPTCPSIANPNSPRVFNTGLIDVQQHGVYTFSTQFTWHAGEYVKFNFGGGYTLIQSHFIGFDQACNPEFSDSVGKAGPCSFSQNADGTGTKTATGIPNPNYRAVVNAPGRRFKLDDAGGFDAWLNATLMF